MRTRMDDRRNTTRSAAVRGRGATRSRGSTVVFVSGGGRTLAPAPSRGRPVTRGRGSPERRGVAGLVRLAVSRPRGRPPGRPRGRGRGRGRVQAAAPLSEEDGDDPSEEEEEEGLVTTIKEEEVDEEDEGEGTGLQLQPESAVSLRRRLPAGSSADSSTEAEAESGDDLLIDVLAASDFGRASRKRQLPARFRDAPLQPLVRRRTVSSGSARADATPDSPQKEETPAPRVAPDRSPLKQSADRPPARSPLKPERSPALPPPTISELLEEQTEVVAAERAGSPKGPLIIEPLESLTEAIELDHGMNCAPPPDSPLRKRQRLRSRSGDATERRTLAGAAFFQDELVEHHPGEMMASAEMDEHDLIMPLDPMEVPLPVETVPRRPCKICHRQFKITNLKQHMLTHTGMRPFKCEFCSAVFTRRSDVFRHVKIVHQQEKPFKCVKDGKEFSDRKTLKAHMERHKRPSLFACKVCDFRFGKFEYYLNHLKFIHPTGEPLPAFPEDVEPEPEPVAPPRGRYGPTPLQAYMDDDDDDSRGAVAGLEPRMGEQLALGGGLENIETEEIPHDSTHVVSGGAAEEVAVGGPAATLLPDSAVPDVVEGQDVVISSAGPAVEPRADQPADKPEEPPPEQINFPPLEEDAAAILGMTDLALTNENTSLQSVAAQLEEQPPPLEAPVTAPVVMLASSAAHRFPEPLISTRLLTQSQPRVVTIGKPVTAASSAKTVLLTRPRMVAGKQVLQAVKLGAGQKLVSARAVTGRGSGSAGRQSTVRQVLINRGEGGASRSASRVLTTRVVRPATRVLPVVGTRTLASAATGSHPLKTASPAIRVVRPAVPPPPAAPLPAPIPPAPVLEPEPPTPPAPVLEPEPARQQQSVALVAAEQTGDDTKNIEVTTNTASGSRTIILQTSGGGGDVLQSEEAMQTLLEAVQQLVSASGDTLEGKQIEIVMQNDGQQGGAPATEAAGAPAAPQ